MSIARVRRFVAADMYLSGVHHAAQTVHLQFRTLTDLALGKRGVAQGGSGGRLGRGGVRAARPKPGFDCHDLGWVAQVAGAISDVGSDAKAERGWRAGVHQNFDGHMAGSHAGAQHIREVQVGTALLQRATRGRRRACFWCASLSTTPGGKVTLSTRSAGTRDVGALSLIPSMTLRPALALTGKGEVLTRRGGHPGAEVQARGRSKTIDYQRHLFEMSR